MRKSTQSASGDAARCVCLGEIASARSGDKGANANIGVIAHSPADYALLEKHLTAAVVETFFKPLGVQAVMRYELPKLGALNFVLHRVLDPLRTDAQGKALGQALLEMMLPLPLAE